MGADTGAVLCGASAVWPHLSHPFSGYRHVMTLRTRKALGTIAFVVWLIVYSLIAMAVGGHFVVGSHMLLELGFYIAAIVPWLLGAMAIIKWMSGPAPE
jgi:hypothetical protein